MIVQFNLLPQVKVEYLKAKRLQRLVVSVTTVAVAFCVLVLIILVGLVHFKQKSDIANLSSDITTHTNNIKSIDGLDRIITIQNQLETLPGLYQKNPQVSRIFSYITQSTPPKVSIGDLSVDFDRHTMTIKGAADGLDDVNAYTDSLKKAVYNDETTHTKDVPAFSNITLSSFNRDQKDAAYSIDFSFDELLFKSGEDITLRVPSTTNTPIVPGDDRQIFKSLNSGNSMQGRQ